MQLSNDMYITILQYIPFQHIDYYLTSIGFKNIEPIKKIIHGHRIKRIDKDDCIEYRIEGKLWNCYGPAVIRSSGTLEYWQNDELHRDGGPAIISASGSRHWFKHNKYHNPIGPAIVHNSGAQDCYIYSMGNFVHWPTRGGYRQYWYIDGLLHRENGPAIVDESGRREYYVRGSKVLPLYSNKF